MQMSARQKAILAAIVEIYSRTGEPVSSKRLAEHAQFRASPATIRSEMAWLFSRGYLEQPHTSAGRVPSHMGYRKYIDSLMACQPLSQEEKDEIESLFNVHNPDPDKLLEDAADALSEYTGTAAVTSSVVASSVRVKRVQLIGAGPRTVVVLLIATNGAIKNRVCRVDFLVTEELLNFFNKFANSRLAGRSLSSITAGYINSVSITLGEYSRIFTEILVGIYELCREINEGQYYVSGGTKLLDDGEALKVGRDLLRLLEQREQLQQLFSLDSDGSKVLIGKENAMMELAGSALVATPYKIGGQPAGIVGLIGPVRLNYAKILPHLEYFSKTLGELLSETFEGE